MHTYVACMGLDHVSHREGLFEKPENQAFAEFKYLEKINYMVMQIQNHNIMIGI